MMQSIWDGQQARGHVPRRVEEIDAGLREAREGWDEHQRGIEGLQEESRRSRELAEGSSAWTPTAVTAPGLSRGERATRRPEPIGTAPARRTPGSQPARPATSGLPTASAGSTRR